MRRNGGSDKKDNKKKLLTKRKREILETLEATYYRIKFANLPYDLFEYGLTALQAIDIARQDQCDNKALGNATARRAMYKEWNYGTEYWTNGGFIRAGKRGK